MAIATPTNLTKSRSTTDAATYNTASVTPTIGADGIVVLFVSHQHSTGGANATLSSVTGCGLTWTIIRQQVNGATVFWRCAVAVGVGTPSNGAITINWSGVVNDCQWTVDQFASGVDVTAGSGTGIVQSAGATGTTSPAAVTLSSFADATNNVAYGGIIHRVNEDITAGSGFSEITADNAGTTPDFHQLTEYHVGQDTSVDFTFATTQTWNAIACEISAATSGVTGTAAWTEAADTATGAGSSTVTGTAAWTEGADTATGAGTSTVTGTAAWTEAADTATGAGSSTVTGPAAWTETADTATGAGTSTVTGTAAWTEAADTCSGSGGSGTSGTAAWTEGADTCTGAGTAGPVVPVAPFPGPVGRAVVRTRGSAIIGARGVAVVRFRGSASAE